MPSLIVIFAINSNFDLIFSVFRLYKYLRGASFTIKESNAVEICEICENPPLVRKTVPKYMQIQPQTAVFFT